MRILMLSWRCPRNPRAGGAEVLTYEVARRLVARGHSVEWFSASFPGASASEDVGGVRVLRAGRQWTVHLRAFFRYRRSIRAHFDVVIDEINTIPFFTPFWAGIPVYALIFQLARDVWWYESKFPFNAVGFNLEQLYLKVYSQLPVVTISESTKQDLEELGFEGSIAIMPIGVDRAVGGAKPKAKEPTFIYVGRLAPSKRVDHIVRAFGSYVFRTNCGQLWLVGGGGREPYEQSLAALAIQLGVADRVSFMGRVADDLRDDLMSRAHVLVMASVREGWGLTVTEANSCGTPAIVYDVPGLRDSVRNGVTGLVTRATPSGLADAMVQVTQNDELYERLRRQAFEWSQSFSFDASADLLEQVLHPAVAGTA